MDFNDETYLTKCLKKDDKRAFNYLMSKYYKALCIYANSLINNHIQAEDVVQNVFVNLWEKRKHLRADGAIKRLLYTSVYNEFIDQYRKTQSVMRIEKIYIEQLNDVAINQTDEATKKLIEMVAKAVESLPPRCKQIFILSKKEGLTNIEIANHLNISIKSVEAQLTKAYKMIRFQLISKIDIVK